MNYEELKDNLAIAWDERRITIYGDPSRLGGQRVTLSRAEFEQIATCMSRQGWETYDTSRYEAL